MVLSHGQGTVKTRIMQIRRGIFQGDSLSPLLFCMALNILSTELNRTGCGYRMSTGNGRTAKRQLISHLLYMDDLKLYGRNPDQLDGLLHTVRTFSDDIRMKFGLDKCAIAHFVNGKLSGHNPGVTVGKTETIKGLEPGQVYKYLGVDESNGIQHSTMRERLRREYFRRVKMVLRTELYGWNKVLAINGLALPVLTYSFGVIHWKATDPQQLDRRTRKLLTMHGVHHPSADVDRLYAPCNEGGRGLQQIEAMYKSCIVGLECYLRDSSDPYMQLVYECDSGRSRYSIKSMACRFTAQLRRDLAKDDMSQNLHGSGTVASDGVFEQAPQMDAKHFRMCNSSLRVRSWSRKPMHGQYRRLTEQSPVDTKETFGWLKAANLPGATEGLVVAAQDQALRTRYYEHHILHRDVSPTCRVCSAGLETVDHIVAGCSAMAPTDYTYRHNQVASIIHWNICRHFQVPVECRWYRHQPDRLVETDDIVVMWDTTIPTAGKIKANRPDICLRDKKANTCLLIDISCPADGNVGRKHAEKLAKYGDLRVEVSRMWQCRTQVVPVVLGALGTVHAGIARWLDIIPGHHNLQHLQKAVLLGSARILLKVMSSSV